MDIAEIQTNTPAFPCPKVFRPPSHSHAIVPEPPPATCRYLFAICNLGKSSKAETGAIPLSHAAFYRSVQYSCRPGMASEPF